MTRHPRLSLLLLALCLLEGLPAAEEFRDAALRQVLGETARSLPLVKTAPEIDGNLGDQAWQGVPAQTFYYADERVDGAPLSRAWFKILTDGRDLFAAFHSDNGEGGGQKEQDHPRFLQGGFTALAWKAGGPEPWAGLLAFNGSGGLYHAKRTKAGAPWEASWNPEGIGFKLRPLPSGYEAELKLPLALFAGQAGTVPQLLRLDLLRRTKAGGSAERAELQDLRIFHAWRQRDPRANARLFNDVDIFGDEDFGTLYFAEGTEPLPQPMLAALRAAAARPDPEQQEARRREVRPPGFEFSPAELEQCYPGAPVLLVPRVASGPQVDGDPRDPVWAQATPVQFGFLSTTIAALPRHNRTFLRALSDEQTLYLLFECEERQLDQLKATPGLVDTGELWREDICDAFLDVGRTQDEGSDRYLVLEANAAGSVSHARGRSDTSWDPPSLRVKTGRSAEPKGWTIELSIAFADCGIEAGRIPKVWGANFLRSRTPGRGVWIDRAQTLDPAYLNFEFAWRGNRGGTAHRPDCFGILYLQAGQTLPAELLEALARRDGAQAAAGLPKTDFAPQATQAITRAPKPTPAWVGKPKVTPGAAQARIEFETSVETEVSVSILDTHGSAVRHLASGKLGAKAPTPLQAGVLRQSLDWDLKDDKGRRVPAGEYRVALGAGLGVEREGQLLWNPQRLGPVEGLATDAAGNLYILQLDQRTWHTAPLLLKFDREGRYLSQLLPYSGALPPERLSGAQRIRLADGRLIPPMTHATHQGFAPELVTLSNARFAVRPSGQLVLLNGIRNTDTRLPLRLLLIGPDGGLGSDYLGPLVGPNARMRSQATLALSPDGRIAYLSGLQDGWGGDEPDYPTQDRLLTKHHAVYRLELEPPADGPAPRLGAPRYPQPFFGRTGEPGEDDAHLYHPLGLAVDAKGNLCVADCWNDRICVLSPEGKLLEKKAVRGAAHLEIHPKTGAWYVLSILNERSILRKFTRPQDPAPALELELPKWTWALMALDASAEKPRLWITGHLQQKKTTTSILLAVEDSGSALVNQGDLIAAGREGPAAGPGGPGVVDAAVDPAGAWVALGGQAVDARSGTVLPGPHKARLRGWDGCYYEKGRSPRGQLIRRFAADGETPRPFEGGQNGELLLAGGSFEFAVDRQGRVYVMQGTSVDRYGPDGALEQKGFIQVPSLPGTSDGVNGTIRVDPEGCVYLDAGMKPLGQEIPAELLGRLPEAGVRPSLWFVYRHLYGSVVRFGPQGGKVVEDPAGDWWWSKYLAGNVRCKAQGVAWCHLGISPLRIRNVEHIPCSCEGAHFDVDAFGRVFLPDALRYECEILDRNGNSLLRFGRYGNMDDDAKFAGPKDQPAFAWPLRVMAREGTLFVADRLNRRLVRLRLTYACEATETLQVPAANE